MSLFKELKRRNVFRVAAAYLVIGWLLVQVIGVLLPMFDVSASFQRGVVLLLIVGFIPAVIFAWAFEITPEGLKKDSEVDKATSDTSQTAKKLDYLTLAAAVGVAGLFAYQQMNPPTPNSVFPAKAGIQNEDAKQLDPSIESSSVQALAGEDGGVEIDAASIAVLPFADLSPAGDQGYFTDGMSEEILNVLVGVDGLKVSSRTSAFAYKGSLLRIPEIAGELGVRHILEGSVRRSGESIRVTAQLIDAKTDEHLLSENFDRKLTAENVFAIQSDIAQLIATALSKRMNIAGLDVPLEVAADTTNLTTLDLYYEANALFLLRGRDNLTRALDLFEQITQNEPSFARGWSGLSAVCATGEGWGLAPRDYEELGKNAANRAIALNPNLSTPYAVLASLENQRPKPDWSFVANNFNAALQRNPDDANLYNWRGLFWEAVGFEERAFADYETCLSLDPSYLNCGYNKHNLLIAVGRVTEADELHRSWLKKGTIVQGYNPAYVRLLANNRDDDNLLMALNLLQDDSYPEQPWIVKELFEALTDPNFNHAQRLKVFEERMEKSIAATGIDRRNSTDKSTVLASFRDFDRAISRPNGIRFVTWPFYNGITDVQKRREIIAAGLPVFWREHGFPPQCRAVGDDDFECD